MSARFADLMFRSLLWAAGGYNLAFGIWAGFWPQEFFRLVGLEPPRYPEIWACLGMVVGIYGFLYWYAAWRPERGKIIVAVGLLGKVLGPMGMIAAVGSGRWPPQAAGICLYNDLIWWIPFTLFLLRDTRVFHRLRDLAPWACAALHVVALAFLPLLLGGTEAQPDPAARALYVGEHTVVWRLGWGVWMASAASLVGFYAWWGARLPTPSWALVAVWVAAAGMVCDWTGELLFQTALVARAPGAVADFLALQRLGTWLTAGAANSLYTLGGILLTLQSVSLPPPIRAAQWTTWTAGGLMTLAAVAASTAGLTVATAVLFPSLILWTLWMGWKWRLP